MKHIYSSFLVLIFTISFCFGQKTEFATATIGSLSYSVYYENGEIKKIDLPKYEKKESDPNLSQEERAKKREESDAERRRIRSLVHIEITKLYSEMSKEGYELVDITNTHDGLSLYAVFKKENK